MDLETLLEELRYMKPVVSEASGGGPSAPGTSGVHSSESGDCVYVVTVVPSPPCSRRRVSATTTVLSCRSRSPSPRRAEYTRVASTNLPDPPPYHSIGTGYVHGPRPRLPRPLSPLKTRLSWGGGVARSPSPAPRSPIKTSWPDCSDIKDDRSHVPPARMVSPVAATLEGRTRSPDTWTSPVASRRPSWKANGLPADYDDLQEKIHNLERDKDNLSLQVKVLMEQIDVQTDKIQELESYLAEKRKQLENVERMLQHELETRSILERQKLDLMTDISNLKLQLASVDKEKFDLQERARKVEIEVVKLKTNLTEKEREASTLRTKLGKSVISQSSHTELELEKMRKTLDSVLNANEEKDKKIEELRSMVNSFRQAQETLTALKSRNSDHMEEPGDSSPTKGPLAPIDGFEVSPVRGVTIANQTAISAMPPPKTPPSRSRLAVDPYGTVPRQHTSASQPTTAPNLNVFYPSHSQKAAPPPPGKQPTPVLGKELYNLGAGNRSTSAPSLAPELEIGATLPDISRPVPSPVGSKPHRSRGFRKIFSRLKRSSSQHLENDPDMGDGNFQRGGLRATAGARLAWTKELKSRDCTTLPFTRWDCEKIVAWLHDMGLTSYMGDCKRWVKNGEQLLKATPHDLEKELGIRNPLHRKKLHLALQVIASPEKDHFANSAAQLDHHWVTRWLDDIGLPQYKDTFSDARVDGRMLHYLTVEDLLILKVNSVLHHVSIKRGIQVLRLHSYNPSCLKRRPGSDENPQQTISDDVARWTNHRVMEWLRSVDLSEYAPNLRGSGVHGALMVFEPRFTAELLATLLSIPPNKTLLRRHLSTHFKQLVGTAIVQQKRELETSSSFVPLTPSTKVKAARRSQFSLMRKKSKAEFDLDDFVCPIESGRAVLGSQHGRPHEI